MANLPIHHCPEVLEQHWQQSPKGYQRFADSKPVSQFAATA
jgi:hypothetical protein